MNAAWPPFTRLQKLVILFISLFALVQVFAVGLNNDTMVLLTYARHLVEDGGLYRNWIEMNPPLIFFLYAIPYYLSHMLNIIPPIAVHVLVVGIIGLDVYWIGRMMRQTRYAVSKHLWIVILVAWILMVPPIIRTVFADREHLLFVFALPWILSKILNVKPSIPMSVAAAIGFCIKPYNALLFLLITVASKPRDSKWLPYILAKDHVIIGGSGLGYLLLILLVFPDYLDVARMGQAAYSVLGWPWPAKREILFYAICFAALPFVLHRYLRLRVWLAFYVGAAFIFLLNGGWRYTQYVLFVPIALAYGFWCIGMTLDLDTAKPWVFVRQQDVWTQKIWHMLKLAGRWVFQSRLIPLMAFLLISYFSTTELYRNKKATDYNGFSSNYTQLYIPILDLMRSRLDTHFVFLGVDVWSNNIELWNGDQKNMYPYHYLWALPYAAMYKDDDNAVWIGERLRAALIRTLETYPDSDVLVDVSPSVRQMPYGYDILGFFMQDAKIRQIFDHYYLAEHIDKCEEIHYDKNCAFDIWKPYQHTPIP